MIDRFGYRPEIDGLRAIAVVIVVLFHADFSFTGGYVGVDVFFVISGYLITSLIWKDLQQGKFTFARFWEKRARRILPAILVMMIATLVAGLFILLPLDLRDLGQSAFAQSVFAGNVYFWIRGGYFDAPTLERALVHTWSLAVEEQFYMIAPLLLWAAFQYKVLNTRKAILSLFATGIVLSLALSIYSVMYHPSAAYYLLPSRAWELMLGGMLAFCPGVPAALGRPVLREVLCLSGMAMILGAAIGYTSKTEFPGAAALLPCVGTALVIWANSRTTADDTGRIPTWIGQALALKPIVFVGLISYSFYLYHWPLLSLGQYQAIVPLSWQMRLALVLAALILAILSWRFVETPFRKRTLGVTRKRMFVIAATSCCFICIVGLTMRETHGLPSRFSEQQQIYAIAYIDRETDFGRVVSGFEPGMMFTVGSKTPSKQPDLLVWGDSHALSTVAAVETLLQEKNMSGFLVTRGSSAPVLGWTQRPGTYSGRQVTAFNQAVFNWIKEHSPAHILMVAAWTTYVDPRYVDSNQRPVGEDLVATVRQIKAMGCQPWVLLDVPIYEYNVRRKLVRMGDSQEHPDMQFARPADVDPYDDLGAETIKAIEAAGGYVIDPKPMFLQTDEKTGESYYIVQQDGRSLYYDSNHLTASGARSIFLPLFRETMKLGDSILKHSIPTQ